MLAEAERLANVEDPSIGRFNLTQGSFSHSVGASAGTHDGPGAFDMYTRSYSAAQKETIGLALRQVGFASWLRRESQGPWDEHWHGIAIGTKGLPSVAASQVQNYLDGLDGLRGNGKDTDGDRRRSGPGGVPGGAGAVDDHPDDPRSRPSRGWTPPTTGSTSRRAAARPWSGLRRGRADRRVRTVGPDDSGRADTDGDGLLDGYEVGTSRSDPLLIDSDLDGFTDAAELRFGGNPLGRRPAARRALGSDSARTRSVRTRSADPVGAGEPQHAPGGLLDP